MVKGIEIFRQHFQDYEKHYKLIGGVACSLLMDEAGLDFRATQDFDIVIIMEFLPLILQKPSSSLFMMESILLKVGAMRNLIFIDFLNQKTIFIRKCWKYFQGILGLTFLRIK